MSSGNDIRIAKYPNTAAKNKVDCRLQKRLPTWYHLVQIIIT